MLNVDTKYDSAEKAFEKQSTVFDEVYGHNIIVSYKRDRTRAHLEKYLKHGSEILELNAGTGNDAIYFAEKGYIIHATDVSKGMLNQLNQKVKELNLAEFITTEQISFCDLEHMSSKKKYDVIFSNFGGLNCTNNLNKVLLSFSDLLKPDGIITLVVMPPICLWEILTFMKGNFKMAFRRLFAKNGAAAHIEGIHFLCWYYWPSYIYQHLKSDFELVTVEGLCTIMPPSYFEKFPEKFPKTFNLLKKIENKMKNKFPFKYIGDYYIITLKKR